MLKFQKGYMDLIAGVHSTNREELYPLNIHRENPARQGTCSTQTGGLLIKTW